VVSTTAGYRGLEIETGRDLLVADDAAGFAAHVLSLLASAERRGELARNGRRFIEKNHDASVADDVAQRLSRMVEPAR
jgi:hypothetical protein